MVDALLGLRAAVVVGRVGIECVLVVFRGAGEACGDDAVVEPAVALAAARGGGFRQRLSAEVAAAIASASNGS